MKNWVIRRKTMGNISTIDALRQTIRAIKSYDKFQLPNNTSASTSQIIVMTPLGRYIDGNYTYGLALSEDKWNEMNEYANELSGTEEGEWLKEHLVEENGEKWWTAPYYAKRLSSAAQNKPAAQATSSGPQVGIITTHNKAAKLNKGEITDVFQYEEDQDELTAQTIMCRDEDGRAIVEDGILPFHIVNKRQLETYTDKKQDKLPENTSGSSNRVWVATNSAYKINNVNAKGIEICNIAFTSAVEFEKANEFEYTGKIITEGFTPKSDNDYAKLARIAELYTIEDKQGNAGAYKDYIRVIPNSSGTSAYVYWTYPYYFKRISAEMANGDSTTATSANAYTGIVTMSNFFSKWSRGEINAGTPYANYASNYKKYLLDYYLYYVCGKGSAPTAPAGIKFSIFNATDNDEPFPQTIATRNPDGQLAVEAGTLPFHAINVKQFTDEQQKVRNEIGAATTMVGKSLSMSFTQTKEDTWVTVASIIGGSHRAALFNFQATGTSGDTTFVTALIESHESNAYKTNIVVLSATDRIFTAGQRRCIKGIRVVAPTQKGTDSYVYLQVKVRDLVSKINISSFPLNHAGTWTLGKSLQPSNEVTYTKYECNLESTLILSDVTKTTNDINNLATQEYVDSKLSTPSEWDFVLNNRETLSEDISNAYGKVLIDMSQWEGGSASNYYLTIPETITYIKFNGWYAYSWDISGHNKCTIEGNSFDWGAIHGFKEVINCGGAGYEIRNCHYVYNSYAADYNNCVYIENCVLDCEPGMSDGGHVASIVNCKHVCHINITENCRNGANITDCGVVENVTSAVNLTYNNCRYVNPYTCQDYVTQQGAVGKVQVLTADGSFAVADPLSRWDMQLPTLYPSWEDYNDPILTLEIQLTENECNIFEVLVHIIDEDMRSHGAELLTIRTNRIESELYVEVLQSSCKTYRENTYDGNSAKVHIKPTYIGSYGGFQTECFVKKILNYTSDSPVKNYRLYWQENTDYDFN